MSASKLDIEKLRKVRGLIDGGATAGERDAARSRATAIAAKAGMTLAQALSKLHLAERPAQPANIFKGFDDWMEEKEPGYKAKKSRELTEREMRNAAKRAEILKQFGTVKAFFSPTPREAILHTAGKPFVTKYSTYTDVCGTRRKDAREFAGVTNVWKLEVANPDAVAAIKTAIPFPDSICGAFAELKEWDKLNNDRALFCDHGEYYFDLRVELRIELLRDVMRTAPATSWDDLEARFRFKAYAWEQQWIDEQTFDDPEWSRLYGDFCILRDKATSGESQRK